MKYSDKLKNGQKVTVVLDSWDVLRHDAEAIRHHVFIKEQAIDPSLEFDAQDQEALHAVVYTDQGQAIATGRLLPNAHIGRMAVLKSMRGTGAGALVLSYLLKQARLRGYDSIVLSAQVHALGFYEKYGFVPEGNEYVDVGIAHKDMRLTL